MIGTALLVLALAGSLGAVWAYYRTAAGKGDLRQFGRIGLFVGAAAIVAASILLLTNILSHDFSYSYVWNYSDRSLPLQYLISTFYAGQEGSFLFWALCSAILSFFLLRYTRTRKIEAHVLSVFLSAQSFLLILLLFKSPFRTIWDAFPGQLPTGQVPFDGKGLNPLLQNFWMVVHPPVLFIGFAVTAIPFSMALAALWRKDYSEWLKSAFPWVLFAGFVLGLGIMLGAYWAYGVLGWGGYWGWDPVENSSLVPWIILMALVHTMLVQKRKGNFVRTNFVLAIVAFLSVIYSTFLTRSGILGDASVHSFTDPGTAVHALLLIFLGYAAAAGFGLFVTRLPEMRVAIAPLNYRSRGFFVVLGSFALLASAVVVLFGTSLPIFSKTTVEGSFYDTMNLPIAVAMVILLGYSLLLRWENEEGTHALRRSLKWILAALVVAGIMFWLGARDAMMLLFGFASSFALFVNLEVAYQTIKGDPRWMGGKVAHIGLALFFLGVLASGKYGHKQQFALGLNSPQKVFGYTLTYTGSHALEGKKVGYDVNVDRDGASFLLTPVMLDLGEQGVLRNPDIRSFLSKDLYLSPISLDRSSSVSEGGEKVTVKKGETVDLDGVRATFVRFDMGNHGMEAMTSGAGVSVGSVLELSSAKGKETITPVAVYNQRSAPVFEPVESRLLGAKVQLVGMNIQMGSSQSTVTLQVIRPGQEVRQTETLIVEASIKPCMNLLWSGAILLFLGLIISMLQRKREA